MFPQTFGDRGLIRRSPQSSRPQRTDGLYHGVRLHPYPPRRGRETCKGKPAKNFVFETNSFHQELSTYLEKNNGTRASFEIWPFHKDAFDGVKQGDSGWPHEAGNVIFPLIGWFEWSGEANDKFWLTKISNALEELRNVALREKCTTKNMPVYLNIALEDDPVKGTSVKGTSVKDVYRDNYGWLKELRAVYDPDNVMRLAAGFVVQ
jgi:hypothetical protein